MPFNIGTLPRAELARTLRSSHDEILWRLKGNIFALHAGYRLLCLHLLKTGRVARYYQLPARLTTGQGRPGISRCGAALDGRSYATICARLQLVLRRSAEAKLRLIPPKRALFEIPSLERGRREVLYAKQMAEFDQIASAWSMNSTEGPRTKPVYCQDLRRWFDSGRDAARFINATTGGKMRGKDIRTAIVRNGRCAGLRFSYDGPAGKRESRIVLAGNEQAVLCLEIGEPAFPSRIKAAAFAGVAVATMKKALDGNGKIGCFTFRYANQPARNEAFPESLFSFAVA